MVSLLIERSLEVLSGFHGSCRDKPLLAQTQGLGKGGTIHKLEGRGAFESGKHPGRANVNGINSVRSGVDVSVDVRRGSVLEIDHLSVRALAV